MQLHPLQVLVVVATRTFIKLLISKIAISDIEAQRLRGRLLCSRPGRRTFLGGLRGLSCRFWSHFGSSGADGVFHKSEVSTTKRESLYFKGLSMVRLSIPAIFLCKQYCFTIVKIMFELLACKKVDISAWKQVNGTYMLISGYQDTETSSSTSYLRCERSLGPNRRLHCAAGPFISSPALQW